MSRVFDKQLLFPGMRFSDFASLMWEARRDLCSLSCPFLFRGVVQSLFMELIAREEARQYGGQIARQQPSDPVFVLGCPRSGTTHLHHILAQDHRFSYPTSLQALYPHTFLFFEGRLRGRRIWLLSTLYRWWFRLAFPRGAGEGRTRGIDGMSAAPSLPQEDAYAMFMMKQDDEVEYYFPSLAPPYREFLSLRGANSEKIERWKSSWSGFLRKLTARYPARTLLLKSPSHTGKVRIILEMFPQAKFVHIRREPHAVFASYKHMRSYLRTMYESYAAPSGEEPSAVNDFVSYYTELYSSYLQDRPLIPPGNLYEMRYEDLVLSPFEETRRAYEFLGLKFGACADSIAKYLDEIKGYRQNVHPALEPLEKQTLTQIRPLFEAF